MLQELESKATGQSEEAGSLRSELMIVRDELEFTKSQSITLRKNVEKAEEDKSLAEQRMNEYLRRMQESEDKRKIAERDSKRAVEAAEKSRAESIAVEREKLEAQKLAAERTSTAEHTQRRCDKLEKERNELIQACTSSELFTLKLLSP